MRVLRTVLQGFQNNMGWSVTELSAGDADALKFKMAK